MFEDRVYYAKSPLDRIYEDGCNRIDAAIEAVIEKHAPTIDINKYIDDCMAEVLAMEEAGLQIEMLSPFIQSNT